MIEQINFGKQKAIAVRWRRFKLFFLALAALTFCLCVNTFNLSPLQAQYVPAATSTNAWQYASFPVENFQAYTSGYGYRNNPVTGQSQFHRGLDMAAPLGSYVRNWWTGRVVELSDHTACGTLVTIQSGQWKHIYCHLMGSVEKNERGLYLVDRNGGIILQKGQEIPVGARIGRVGMTGRTTGPHLHWGLMFGRDYIDPALVLQEMFRYRKFGFKASPF